ncbi:unnamed protein product [Rangifer tarandus platyrhynchus]|uniref:Uncharacterized protein n=2 Tax=Rangifer tarandus platyrhynchus TaxID=3082113 RepID=A0ABN8ZN69_RANTA|nr:unnamed protein product [Rangifer tarandus platyrhynchus]
MVLTEGALVASTQPPGGSTASRYCPHADKMAARAPASLSSPSTPRSGKREDVCDGSCQGATGSAVCVYIWGAAKGRSASMVPGVALDVCPWSCYTNQAHPSSLSAHGSARAFPNSFL